MAVPPSSPRYQVFVSSTYEDLREERQQATQAILEMGHFPAGMELFPASDQSQADLIRRVVSESDYYILILAGRYGSTDVTGLSYTEMEYDWAVDLGVPVLAFVRRNIEEVPAKWTEQNPEKRERLKAFRAKVQTRHVRLYDTAAELGMYVMKSLMSESRINPRVGWIHADELPPGLDPEIERQLREDVKSGQKEIKRLERALRDRVLPLNEIGPEMIAQGEDTFELTIWFKNQKGEQEIKKVPVTWDEVFATIGPSMYGYIQRRFRSGHSDLESYKFETDLIDLVRIRYINEIGARQVKIFSHEVDTILIQFQQLGYVALTEKEKSADDKDAFRGYTLTRLGEERLTRLKLSTRASA